jgi:flavin reductase (DIM6/NTAB) family NADH-FMN oxidoreductase RutF
MAVTQDEFRAALSRFPSGVTVVTTRDANGRFFGITVSAFCSVSLQPPMILVCIEKTTGSHNALTESGVFVVNILGEGQSDISEHFASVIPDKFDKYPYHLSSRELPILDDIAVSLECSTADSYAAGDHTIFVGHVETVKFNTVDPLIYHYGDYHLIAKGN